MEQILESTYFKDMEKWNRIARQNGGLEICGEDGYPIYTIGGRGLIMEDLKIDTKVSIDFATIKDYLEDNGLKIVTNKNHQLLNSHPELNKLEPHDPRTWVNDPRYSSWCDEESTRGFADFELWNLDATMVELLYERLVNFPLLDRYSTGDGNRDEDIKKAYNQIINLCKKYLKDDGESILNKDKEFKKIWQVWSKYGLGFWC